MPNTTGNANETAANDFAPPAISLPKGGGAIRGIGEKFAANPVTGTGSMTVPIATSPGRSGFGPQLALSYDSGAGNGPFGLGWNLSLPSITRKTDKGLPTYHDDQESDTFILSGAEDLVPVLVEECGEWRRKPFVRSVDGVDYQVQRYRPRIEGLFARIERWVNLQTRDTHWRSITRDNITTFYGKTAESRIADPADCSRVFSWLICESFDDKGNAIRYEYVSEDSAWVELKAHERNRTDESRSANRYLKRIKYGNLPSRLIEPDLSKIHWLFEVVFDYGEGHYELLPVDQQGRQFVRAEKDQNREWPARQDPFSSYRSGFEVRTYRLCQRVLMFHHFPEELGTDDYLVRSTEFNYQQSSLLSFITDVTQSGYVRRPDETYLKKSLPPIEYEYSQAIIDERIQEIDAASLENLPYGLDGANYRWVDLDGEGLSGILTEQGDTWFYKENLGGARFGALQVVAAKPSLAALNRGPQQLLDLAGDGQLDLVQLSTTTPGFYERTQDQLWEPFTPFASLPNISFDDPNLRFVDLTGDGHADVLITEHEALTWYPSLAEEGFGQAEKVRQALEEERGPRVIFTDSTQSIFLADMSGDGLSDIVRIRNGEVCYWPSLGYGRFGAKVTMDQAPVFDMTDLFDQRRLHLADIDGSGVSDIIYLARDGIQLYFNQSGNSWAAARSLPQFPRTDNLSLVTVVDLLGNGTACVVWSSPMPGYAQRPMRYIDLMGGQKPHLMIGMKNNMGAETRLQYASSTKFYLADKISGKPWITKLPFPVHVVERVETLDRISRNRFVTRYAYHHGYFDGVEREFRGFGMVEQQDTEEFAALSANAAIPDATNIDQSSHVPPVLTKTWFHTGFWAEDDVVSHRFKEEYYREPGLSDSAFAAQLLPDTILPSGLSAQEERQAHRALKGSILRQETYALDNSPKRIHPYVVSERNYTIEQLQPLAENRFAVFFTHPRETIDYQYERNPIEPRITHALTLEVDAFGNGLRSAAVTYGRRNVDPSLATEDQAKQAQTLITSTENRFTEAIELANDYRAPLPCETRTFELGGLTSGADGRFDFKEIDEAAMSAAEISYEAKPSAGLQKRLIEHVRTVYRRNDLTDLLPLGQLESLALPGESGRQAFTPGLLRQVYQERVTEEMMAKDGGYAHSEGDENWWIPSGRIFFSASEGDSAAEELDEARKHFFQPRRFHDPFANSMTLSYDAHDLLSAETRDALGNTVRAETDYRTMQPRLVTDPNGNRAATAFDALGLVVGTAVMGKESENLGDSSEGFEPDLDNATIDAHLQDSLSNPHDILNGASTRMIYDLHRYQRTQATDSPQPNVVYTLKRETHDADLLPGEQTIIQHSFSYSDGFEREIQKKVLAEPGPVPRRDANGKIIIAANGQPETTPNDVTPRWVGSGWKIFNNKSKPVRHYEPFFTDTHHFEFGIRIGVSPVLCYDPAERVVATLYPNHTWEKVVFNPWRQETWDVSDTVLVADPKTDGDVGDFFQRLPRAAYSPTWHAIRESGTFGAEEQDAAAKAAVHSDTPTIAHFDSLARTFLTIKHNRFMRSDLSPTDPPTEEFYLTRVTFDMEGNQREVIDARERVVRRYDYDMLGNRVHEASMDAGDRWMLSDVTGKAIYGWNSRAHQVRTVYDPLRRPTDSFLSEDASVELLVGRTVYGETQPDPEAKNQRGETVQIFDQAGVVTSGEYDFKGNLLRTERQLAEAYKSTLDWSRAVPLEAEIFTTRTSYDALNRPAEQTAPDNSVIRLSYNEANLLERVEANLRAEQSDGQPVWTLFISDIDYDAKGQRTMIDYGNRVRTTFTYDPLTFRLVSLLSRRDAAAFEDDCPPPHLAGWSGRQVQNLRYTYDPVGNITHIRDDAQQAIYFRNRRVEPNSSYTYDAVYRLIEATGREHLGQVGARIQTPTPPDAFNHFHTRQNHPADGEALGTYSERYFYDAVGNILAVQHQGSDPAHAGWSRSYEYDEASLIEPGVNGNRMSRTTVGSNNPITEPYAYDAHGNMTLMAHLRMMQWDYRDQLQATAQQVVANNGTPETTWYVYDAAGQRVRKVTEHETSADHSPTRVKERIYLGGFEIYRVYQNGTDMVKLERQTLHLADEKRRIALVETRTQGQDGSPLQMIRYQYSNHLESATLELDDQAQIISYEEYTPYGSTSYQAVRSYKETPKRYRYIGKERDEETGFNYHGARYYAPWLGRWISSDPSGLRDGVNTFAYVNNNPVNKVDHSGNFEISWTDVAIGAGIAIVAVALVAVTAGAAAPAIAAAIGVTTADVLATAAVVGTGVGVVTTAHSVAEIREEMRTGIDPNTGQPISDAQISRQIGGTAVGAVATVLGARGISFGGGTPPSGAAPQLVPSFAGGPRGFSSPAVRWPQISVAATPAAAAIAVGTTGAATTTMMMSSMGGGGGGGGGGSDPEPEELASRSEEPRSRDLRSVDPQGEPVANPEPPGYEHPSRPVVDHILNRARGGPPTDPANLDVKTWEANSRKAGFEGNYTRDLARYMRQGLTRAQAEYVLKGEAEYIVNDVHARPVDPFALDAIPDQLVCLPEPPPVCR